MLLFVSIPVLTTFILIGCMAYLQHQAEVQAERADRAKRFTEIINKLAYGISEVATITDVSDLASGDSGGARGILKKVKELDNQFAELKELTKNDPTNHQIVLNAENGLKEVKETFRELLKQMMSGQGQGQTRKGMWKHLRAQIRNTINNDLLRIGKDQERVASESPFLQAENRRWAQLTLGIIGGFNLIFAVIASLWLVRNLRSRLRIMTDNTLLLAAGKPLHKQVRGGDEIALFDSTFHQMARRIAEASRKERAIVENALDMICSLDKTLRFLSVNPASRQYLLMTEDEILGRRLVEFLPKSQVDQVTELIEAMKADAEINDLELKLIRRDGSEIHTVWSMRFSEVEQSISCVVHNVSERKRAEELRQELVAMITHDLCTPLASISNSVESISFGGCGELNERGVKLINLAQKNTVRMETLIDDLLDIEKARAGMMQISKTKVSLPELFKKVSEMLEPLAAKNSMTLVVIDTDIAVEADEGQLQRILTNLAGNALKYAGKGAEVVFSATQKDEVMELSVKDNGPGIPEDKREHLFERFYQTTSEHYELGSGLGLAICKTLVDLHGGSIAVKSEIGQGTEFVVTLPKV
jgi:PAS domain S-box-containing protein